MGYDVSTTLAYGIQVEPPEDQEEMWSLEGKISKATGGVYLFVTFDDSAWASPRGCFITIKELYRRISHGNSIDEDNYFFKCDEPDISNQVVLNLFDVAKEFNLTVIDSKPKWVIGCHGG